MISLKGTNREVKILASDLLSLQLRYNALTSGTKTSCMIKDIVKKISYHMAKNSKMAGMPISLLS